MSAGNGIHDAADAYFDFDIPGSPVDESEYARLINTSTTSTTTPQENASESGYVCASPISSVENNLAEHSDSSSTDEPFFDPENSDVEQRSLSLSAEFYDCDETKKDACACAKLAPHPEEQNGVDGNRCDHHTDSLPVDEITLTATTSESPIAIGNDVDETDFCAKPQLLTDTNETNDTNDTNETNGTNGLNGEHTTPEDSLHESNHKNDVAIQFDSTISISTNEAVHRSADIQEIPKYDHTNAHKDSLSVENFVNGHSSEDDEEPAPRSERFRRSSSLKTGKTPPGTPGRKKIVRFADVLGLDLADVRTFLDEIPKVPKSAFDELCTPPEPPISLGQRLDKIIVPLFQQPCASPNFLDAIQLQNVALENAAVTDPICLTITGIVRVRNLDFHKSVHIRYSLDAWQSYSDLQAEYLPNSCDGFSDRFSFTVFGNSMEIGQRIEIAIRFSCKGEQFWDNNHGVNYCFQCMPATTPQSQTVNNNVPTDNHHNVHLHDTWCGSFY